MSGLDGDRYGVGALLARCLHLVYLDVLTFGCNVCMDQVYVLYEVMVDGVHTLLNTYRNRFDDQYALKCLINEIDQCHISFFTNLILRLACILCDPSTPALTIEAG